VNHTQLVVPPAASRSLLVTFSPQQTGPLADTLELHSNDPVLPLATVSLLGEGTETTTVGDNPWADPSLTFHLSSQPNPFNPGTEIRLVLPGEESTQVTRSLFDLKGRVVRSLLRGRELPAGEHRLHWDGRGTGGAELPSGIYFARLEFGSQSVTHKMTLVR
jgi:hypothetical protein